MQAPNPYLDFLIEPNFEGLKRLFVLLFEDKDDRILSSNRRNKGL